MLKRIIVTIAQRNILVIDTLEKIIVLFSISTIYTLFRYEIKSQCLHLILRIKTDDARKKRKKRISLRDQLINCKKLEIPMYR